jgi:4-hydroxybenzoate polyprenyltransferase/phosphoserine phosphatase
LVQAGAATVRPDYHPNSDCKALENKLNAQMNTEPAFFDRSAGPLPQSYSSDGPLYVDMDGTLLSTDLLHETALLFLARHPLEAWKLLPWLLAGKAHLKRQLASRCLPDASTLPYRAEVLEFLREQSLCGRELVLATAGDQATARSVAEHLGFFSSVLASNGSENLAGQTKLSAILNHCGNGRFGYVGDSRADLPVWGRAGEAYVVASTPRLLRAAAKVCRPRQILGAPSGTLRALVRALRLNQSVKNVLLLVPLFAAHKLGSLPQLRQALLGVLAFSMCASAIYIINDLLDLQSDRLHPRKQHRPFASGKANIPAGVCLSAALVILAFLISLSTLPSAFTWHLGVYLAATTAYSLFFKRRLLQDVFVLAGLYTLRLLAGGAASSVSISPWLLAFALFFFLSLAYLKRYSELLQVADRNQREASGRGYLTKDNALVESVGPASGYIAVMVLCLYVNSPAVAECYSKPSLLWLLCPVFLYWITRMWFLAGRRTLADDPVVFAATDGVSLLAGIAAVIIVTAAI